jgi:hypothetical protein
MTCQALYTNNLRVKLVSSTIDPFGIFLNGLCLLCFAQILWHRSESNASNKKSNMFKYFLVKAFFEFFYFSNDIVYFMVYYFCDGKCHLHATPHYLNWFVYVYSDFEWIVRMLAPLIEIAATFGKLNKIFF